MSLEKVMAISYYMWCHLKVGSVLVNASSLHVHVMWDGHAAIWWHLVAMTSCCGNDITSCKPCFSVCSSLCCETWCWHCRSQACLWTTRSRNRSLSSTIYWRHLRTTIYSLHSGKWDCFLVEDLGTLVGDLGPLVGDLGPLVGDPWTMLGRTFWRILLQQSKQNESY